MTRPADFEQRAAALNPNGSYAIAAPAGSGKTGLLTQRVLTLLLRCNNPEEILSITFTRKAAAEMRLRIVAALGTALNDTPPEQEFERQTWQLGRNVLQRDKELNWHLLDAPNRLRIQTIDGLCRDLARQLVLENGLGELPQPADNPSAYYREAIQNTFSQLDHQSETADAMALLLGHFDNNMQRVENLLSGLLAKREQWLRPIWQAKGDTRPYLEAQLRDCITDTLHAAQTALQPVTSDLALLVDYAAGNLNSENPHHPLCQLAGAVELPPADPDLVNPWKSVLELLLTQKDEWRKSIDKRTGFPAGKGEAKECKELWKAVVTRCSDIPGLLEHLQDIRYLPYSDYPHKQWQILQALASLLPPLVAELSLTFLQYNACDFTEITLAALQALGTEDEPTDTALRLDYRIQHILIDEFQDTSSIQFELLKKLTAGWQPDDGRTLFLVGDGMQSLYGFRSANVGLFLQARQHPIGAIQLTPMDLTVNFRSQNNIVSWVNQVFKHAFPIHNDINRGAVQYSDSIAFKPALAGQAVTVDGFVDAPDRKAEATKVVQHILSAQQDQDNKSTAVLVRNRGCLTELLPAMYQAGLNWQAVDIEPLSQRMAVMDVHSLTRALLSFADRIAWLAILRAPWCGLSLTDIHELATAELAEFNPIPNGQHFPLLWVQIINHQHISTISNTGQLILKRVSITLQQSFESRNRKSLRSWIEGLWIALGGPAALMDSNDIQHVRSYFDLLETHSRGSNIDDWEAFTNAVEQLYAAPSSDADSTLQVMTIHKSKGLEFDTVIIPALDKTQRSGDSEMLLWRERINQSGDTQLLLSSVQASGSDDDQLFKHLKREAKEKTRLENTRVIYVGATRAIKRLHLMFNIKQTTKGDLKAPGDDSLLKPLWNVIEPELLSETNGYQLHHLPTDESIDTEVETLSHYVRLPADWQAPSINYNNPLQAFANRSSGFEDRHNNDKQSSNNDSRYIGTVLHRTLQQVVEEGVSSWNAERITRQQPAWAIQLQQLGVNNGDAACQLLSDTITAMCNDPKAQWLLDNSHCASACEQEIFYQSQNKQRKAIIDRTFIDNGQRWIIDYKSAHPEGNESLDSFLQGQRQAHQPQLDGYASLFAELEHLPIQTALYFPLLGHLETF